MPDRPGARATPSPAASQPGGEPPPRPGKAIEAGAAREPPSNPESMAFYRHPVLASLALGRVAAIDGDRRSRHKVGGLAGEEDSNAAHVLGRAPAPRRRAHQHHAIEARYLRPRPPGKVGVDP